MDTQSFSQLSIGSPSVRPLSLPDGDPSSGSTPYIRGIVHGRHNKQLNIRTQDAGNRRVTSITILADDVLLDIFHFYRYNHDPSIRPVWTWHILVHVCQRWRQVVFASPRRLNLQIFCTYGTPVRKNLDIWPAFPIVVDYSSFNTITRDQDNVIAALEHPDRVCSVRLNATGSQLGKMITAMQKPFPVLTHLSIASWDFHGHVPVLPAEFLGGGSAPCLQEISLFGVLSPALGTLLLSASDLIKLEIRDIPRESYISPEAMVACLAAMPKLEILTVDLPWEVSPRTHLDQIRPPSVTRVCLPALTDFHFRVESEYLEPIVAHIDSPQLDRIYVQYWDKLVDLVPQLAKFIDRSMGSELTPYRCADVRVDIRHVTFTLYRRANYPSRDRLRAQTTFRCRPIDYDVSHIAQVFSQFSDTLSKILHLKLWAAEPRDISQLDGTDSDEWLHLFHQFPNMQTLYVCRTLAWHVALALEGITAAAKVLPSLNLICLEDQPASSVRKFVAARRRGVRPVTVIGTETEYDKYVYQMCTL